MDDRLLPLCSKCKKSPYPRGFDPDAKLCWHCAHYTQVGKP